MKKSKTGSVAKLTHSVYRFILNHRIPIVEQRVISFKGRHHKQELILQCVLQYVAYPLSYRDLEGLMAERG